jgi:hypothetical protein
MSRLHESEPVFVTVLAAELKTFYVIAVFALAPGVA